MKTIFIIILTLIIGFGLGIFAYKYFNEQQLSVQNLPKIVTGTCNYEGKTYKVGNSFPASDGCNSCSCENGNVICTEMACGDSVSIENETQECFYNNKTYREGDSFQAGDGCNSCSCENGQVICTLMACE